MAKPPLYAHIRDILLLPFTVTVIIPFLIITNTNEETFCNYIFFIFGLLFYSSGLVLLIYTNILFRTSGKGSLAPWTPTQKLVIEGPYRHCRNPMITGVLAMLTGECLFFCSIYLALSVFLFFLINSIYFVYKEEPDLLKRFGEDYTKYKENVPRWIPKIKPYIIK